MSAPPRSVEIPKRSSRLGVVAALGIAMATAPRAQVSPPDAQPETHEARPAPPDEWFGRDKAKHAGVSFALTVGGAVALRHGMGAARGDAVPFALGTTLALGVTKELADARRPHAPLFSWRDLAADVVGAALGALVASL